MSLLEKLGEKRAQKLEIAQKTTEQQKKQSLEEINNQVIATEAKKQRIIELSKSLRANYQGGEKKLADFKNQKEELKNAYEEHKDILEEEGISSFEEMIEANAEEREVKQLRRSGGRGPAKEDGEAGETGELYKTVGILNEIKESLQSEMPDVKLNFSAVTKKGEEVSNRENSFAQIEEYLKTLDEQIVELKNQSEEAKLETPEGKREALLKIDNPEDTVRSVDFNNIDHFYFQEKVMSLSEKIGAEAIKDEYSWRLRDKLQLIAWKNKSLNQKDIYNNKSPEQEAILAYQDLKKLDELSYNHDDLDKLNSLYRDTLNHLEDIFNKNETTYNRLVNSGLLNGRDEQKGWDEKRLLADSYIKRLERADGMIMTDKLIKTLASSQKQKNEGYSNTQSVYSPERLHAEFERYNKFLEYIIKNTDVDTQFIKGDYRNEQSDLLAKINGDKETRKEIGLDEIMPQFEVSVPIQFIRNSGGFNGALARSKQALEPWQKEMKAISAISTAAVESRFAQEWERYFSRKNKDFLEKIDYSKTLIDQIENSLRRLENGLFKDPEFANRKIKLAKGGYNNDSIIEDISADEEYNRFSKAADIIRKEIDEYANNKKTEIEKAIGSLKRQIVVFGRDSKIEALNKKWQIFEDFRKDNPLNDGTLKKDGISDEEIAIMKEDRKKRNDNDAEYKRDDAMRLKFIEASKAKNFFIGFKSGADILDGQEMTVEELPERLKARLAELKAELANLSESELAIVNERDRSVKDAEACYKKFQDTAINNADIIGKNDK